MPQTMQTSQWVPFPVELVFAFFASPNNLPHLMPVWQQARIERSRLTPPPPRPFTTDPALRFRSEAAGEGSEIAISFRPVPRLPLRIGWIARITEFAWNDHFCDEQLKGPFRSWTHCHRTLSEARDGVSGTRIDDEVEYTLPMGYAGLWADRLFLRRQMENTFAYRQHRLEEILPVVSRQAARRS